MVDHTLVLWHLVRGSQERGVKSMVDHTLVLWCGFMHACKCVEESTGVRI